VSRASDARYVSRCHWCRERARFLLIDLGRTEDWPPHSVVACHRHRREWADTFDTVERIELGSNAA